VSDRPHLFVDSDGVFFDFDGHVKELFGGYPNQLGDAEMWRLANAHPNFFKIMPLRPEARDFWEAIKHVNPTVLTGCPKGDYDRAAEHKREAWEEHFQHAQVITCLSRDKALHIKNEGDWLVDDMGKNCKRWGAAGGKAIRYTGDWESVVKVLREQGVI
jgi:hypothetical protein